MIMVYSKRLAIYITLFLIRRMKVMGISCGITLSLLRIAKIFLQLKLTDLENNLLLYEMVNGKLICIYLCIHNRIQLSNLLGIKRSFFTE